MQGWHLFLLLMNWEEEEELLELGEDLSSFSTDISVGTPSDPTLETDFTAEEETQPKQGRARRSNSFRKRRDSDLINFAGMFKRRHSLTDAKTMAESAEETFAGLCENRKLTNEHTISTPQVLKCSEPQMILSPHGGRKLKKDKEKEQEISEAVGVWAGGPEVNIKIRSKKSPKLKGFKRRISRTLSREKMDKYPTQSLFSAKFSFAEAFDGTISIDPRITEDISLFYLRQQLPSEFPYPIIRMLYFRASTIPATQNMLIERGWELKSIEVEETDGSPDYYFGSWSYDCWTVFEGQPTGSFISCHKQNRYYVMHKNADGKVVLDSMNKGPMVSRPTRKRLQLTKGITRPPKRYICEKCSQNTPCELTESKEGHESVLRPFVISYPLQISMSSAKAATKPSLSPPNSIAVAAAQIAAERSSS